MISSPRRRSRAFTIGHMLFALVLLGAFAVAAARVFRQSILTTRTAAEGQERSIRLEQLAERRVRVRGRDPEREVRDARR